MRFLKRPKEIPTKIQTYGIKPAEAFDLNPGDATTELTVPVGSRVMGAILLSSRPAVVFQSPPGRGLERRTFLVLGTQLEPRAELEIQIPFAPDVRGAVDGVEEILELRFVGSVVNGARVSHVLEVVKKADGEDVGDELVLAGNPPTGAGS